MVTEEVFNEEINKRPIAYPAVIEDGVIIEPGKKINPELVDIDWYAGKQVSGAFDVTFDGDMTDAVTLDINGNILYLVKISDAVPTLEEFKKGNYELAPLPGLTISPTSKTVEEELNNGTAHIIADDSSGLQDFLYFAFPGTIAILSEDVDYNGVKLLKGVYVGDSYKMAYISRLYIPHVTQLNEEKLPEKYLPDTIARVSDVENVVGALAPVATTGSYNDLSDKPEYSILLKDVDTSYRYNVFIKNGTLTTSIACASIRVDSIPDKEYAEGDKLDLSDAVVIAIGEDGSERQVTGFTYPETVPSADNPEIIIYYTEFGRDFTAMIELPVKSFADSLIDFEYTVENDGTYTLTAWKETLNGEPSTELIIPEDRRINV